jgi:hypothetical protein
MHFAPLLPWSDRLALRRIYDNGKDTVNLTHSLLLATLKLDPLISRFQIVQ